MTALEQGFLLLSSRLGNPERKPLTTFQLRTLALRMQNAEAVAEDRELEPADLVRLGYSREAAGHICALLEEEALLKRYLSRGEKARCVPVTRVSPAYPLILRQRLGPDSPGCLWCKGDTALLNTPAIALVGSRDLKDPNRIFAEEVGFQAARQGLTLVSGDARGADQAAQNACLAAGGKVISVVADRLSAHALKENVLYVSEEDFDGDFSAQRAHSRNRVIHALGRMVFVAQSGLEKGGTWQGTAANLKSGWSSVACFRDGSEASRELEQLGAWLIGREDLADLGSLPEKELSFFAR